MQDLVDRRCVVVWICENCGTEYLRQPGQKLEACTHRRCWDFLPQPVEVRYQVWRAGTWATVAGWSL